MYQVVLFNNKTVGRDKLARLIQYASKATWYALQQCNANGSSISKIKDLEYILGNFRKLLRFGRCLDTLYTATCLFNHDDVLINFNAVMSKIAYSIYLLCDHIIWFGRCGFADVDTNSWHRIACKYWLLTIVMNLSRDYFELRRIISNTKISFQCKNSKILCDKIYKFGQMHKDVVLDTLKNSCDIFLPLAALNYVNLNPGIVGMLGVISSIIGIYTVVDPYAKLPLS